MKRVYSHCNNCGCNFEFEFKNGFLTSNMTAQRLDNSIATKAITAKLGVSYVIAVQDKH